MKIINVKVKRETFELLQSGERGLDVRVDVPKHEVGDLIVYTMIDENGAQVDGANIAFLVQSKVGLEEFVERIGEQMMRKAANDTDELIIITLSHVPGQGS